MSGRITGLELVNFRSHLKTHVHFDGRPVAIMGPNGAGKTNLLEAISLFSPGRGLRRADREAYGRQPENLGWKISLTAIIDDLVHIVNSAKAGEARQVMINDKSATQTAMGHYLRMVWMTPAQDRIWIDSATDRRKFFDRIVLSFFPNHGENVLAFEKGMRERNKLLKDGVFDEHWYFVTEARMAEAAKIIVSNRAEAIARLNAEMILSETIFPVAELTLDYNIDNPLDHDWAQMWAQDRQQDRYAGTTKRGPHRVNCQSVYVTKSQNAALCSTGEQKALLISLMLANARALIADGHFVTVLLDEVAAHLDEDRRALLFDEICALDAHVLMTGTEAELFHALSDRGQYFEVREDASISQVKELK